MDPLNQVNINDQAIIHEGKRRQSVTQEDSRAICGSRPTILGLDGDGNLFPQISRNVGNRH